MYKEIVLYSYEFNGVDLLKVIDWLVWLGFKVKVINEKGFNELYGVDGLEWNGDDSWWD